PNYRDHNRRRFARRRLQVQAQHTERSVIAADETVRKNRLNPYHILAQLSDNLGVNVHPIDIKSLELLSGVKDRKTANEHLSTSLLPRLARRTLATSIS